MKKTSTVMLKPDYSLGWKAVRDLQAKRQATSGTIVSYIKEALAVAGLMFLMFLPVFLLGR